MPNTNEENPCRSLRDQREYFHPRHEASLSDALIDDVMCCEENHLKEKGRGWKLYKLCINKTYLINREAFSVALYQQVVVGKQRHYDAISLDPH